MCYYNKIVRTQHHNKITGETKENCYSFPFSAESCAFSCLLSKEDTKKLFAGEIVTLSYCIDYGSLTDYVTFEQIFLIPLKES